MPKVSVVIPTYNRAHRLEEAIGSIQGQNFKDLEIIVVDDGSKDGTDAVMARLMKGDTRIRFVKQDKNRGAQAARNRGIRESGGEWIAFLDSDDKWYPKSLELRLTAAEKENAEVVHSGADILETDGQVRRYNLPEVSGEAYKKLLRGEGPMFQSLLVKKKSFEKIKDLDESLVAFQEWDTAIRLAKHFRFAFVPEATFLYDCRGTDTISRQMFREGKGYEQVLRKHAFEMLRLTGAWTLVFHYEAVARWYEKGGDLKWAAYYRRIANRWKLLHPGSVLGKLSRIFGKKEKAGRFS